MSQVLLKRFNAKIEAREWPVSPNLPYSGGHLALEFYTYDLCNGVDHFHYSGFLYGQGTGSCSKIGECNGSCGFGQKIVHPQMLPWEVQEAVGFKERVPEGFLLVHQRFAYDNRPYFKVFGGGMLVCPAMSEKSHLLPNGHQTVVLTRDRKSKQTRTLIVANLNGKPVIQQVAQVVHNAWPGENIHMVLKEQAAQK